ncbi:MAG: preprotein translocase subunit YajC [Acidimicrobiia bacterium]|nr:preprotein translocase subunit YajC [Acidimicrobiia bacterium]
MLVYGYFGLLVVGFYFLLVRPQRRQIAARRAIVAAIEVGDDVVTAGGIHGVVASIDTDLVGLEIAPGVVITIARGAINARHSPMHVVLPGVGEPDETGAIDAPSKDELEK